MSGHAKAAIAPAPRRSSMATAVMVLGMHRSGTSAMTRLMSLTGARLPEHLLPAGPDNPAGFWEPRLISELNEEILRSEGFSWDDPFCHRVFDRLDSVKTRWFGAACEAFRQSYREPGPIVMKDPRLSLLSALWIDVLRAEGFEPRAILVSRAPAQIAASLAVRNAMPQSKSWLLYAGYMLSAERATRRLPRAFVEFDGLLDRPYDVLKNVTTTLGLSQGKMPTRREATDCMQADLRHHGMQTPPPARAFAEIAELAEAFNAAANGAPFDTDVATRCSAWLADLDSWLGPFLEDERERRAFLEAEIGRYRAFEAHLGAGVVELKGEINRLSEIAAQQHDEILRLSTQQATGPNPDS